MDDQPVLKRRIVCFPSHREAFAFTQNGLALHCGFVYRKGDWIASGSGLELRLVVIVERRDLDKLRGLFFDSADTSRLPYEVAVEVEAMIRSAA